jgi:hypothetical protein
MAISGTEIEGTYHFSGLCKVYGDMPPKCGFIQYLYFRVRYVRQVEPIYMYVYYYVYYIINAI